MRYRFGEVEIDRTMDRGGDLYRCVTCDVELRPNGDAPATVIENHLTDAHGARDVTVVEGDVS